MILAPFLDILGYSFLFGIGKVKLYRYSLSIANRILFENLYMLELPALPFVSVTLFFILLVA